MGRDLCGLECKGKSRPIEMFLIAIYVFPG